MSESEQAVAFLKNLGTSYVRKDSIGNIEMVKNSEQKLEIYRSVGKGFISKHRNMSSYPRIQVKMPGVVSGI